MAEITAALVKELREKSGVGMMDCKKALQETGGDMQAAIDWLRAKGLSKAAKKADRAAAEGLVAIAVRAEAGGMTAAAVELNAETDFVARNELFQNAARTAAHAALDEQPEIDAINAAKGPDGQTIGDLITNLIATIGENMVLRRAARFSVTKGAIGSYVHNQVAPGLGKIGVLVAVEGEGDQTALAELGKKIAMHVAATSPLSLSSDDLDPAAIEYERGVLTEKAREEGRPDNMIEKIVSGQIAKFQREVVLLEQPFVMNPDQTVKQLIAETPGAKVTGFVRLALGEGVEKKADDFAAEVASMTGG